MVTKTKYMNPFLAGFLLGIVLLASIYFTGRGLGASGAVKSAIVSVVQIISPDHIQSNDYYNKYVPKDGSSPLNSWLVFEILGVLFGAFISGAVGGRLKFQVEHAPFIKRNKRLFFAGMGGVLMGFGAALGRGCTSGAALSGMAVFATSGFISFLAIFGTAFVVAILAKRLWVRK